MFLEILVAVGGYRLFKGLRRRRPSGSRSAGRVKRSSHEIGEAGEAVAQAKLRTTLQWLCGDDFYLHDGPLLIEHAPGTAFPTAEIDHLASRARAAVLMYAETSANSLLDDKTR